VSHFPHFATPRQRFDLDHRHPIGEEECFQLGGGRERLLADGSSRRF